jgi:transposase-like protein
MAARNRKICEGVTRIALKANVAALQLYEWRREARRQWQPAEPALVEEPSVSGFGGWAAKVTNRSRATKSSPACMM